MIDTECGERSTDVLSGACIGSDARRPGRSVSCASIELCRAAALAIACLVCIVQGAVGREVVLSFAPNPAVFPPVGVADTLLVSLHVESDELLMGVRLDLRFDNRLIRVRSFEAGPFLLRNGGEIMGVSTIHNDLGQVDVNLAVGGGSPVGVSGEGVLLRLVLQAVSEDPAGELEIREALPRDPGNAAIQAQWENLRIEAAAQQESASTVLPLPRGYYALVSLPMNLPGNTRLSDVMSDLGPYGADSWRGYGMKAGRLVPDPAVDAGHAFWLSTAAPRESLRVEGTSVAGPLAVDLRPGWNAVGVPWREPAFAWAEVGIAAGDDTLHFGDSQAALFIAPHVWWWVDHTPDQRNNGRYLDAGVADAMSTDGRLGGFLVFVREECSLVHERPETARSPAMQDRGSNGRREVAGDEEPDWLLQITAAAGDGWEQSVTVGARSGSEFGADPGDVLCPPFLGDELRIVVHQEGCEWGEYMRAYSPPGASEYAWELAVSGSHPVVLLAWDGIDAILAGFHASLIPSDGGAAVDMRSTRSHCFVLSGGMRTFTVLLEEMPYEGAMFEGSPAAIRIVSPNPVRDRITVEYTLAAAGAFDLRILDVSGRVVSVLDSGFKDAGRYLGEFPPGPRPIGSGVYFLRLSNAGITDAKRVAIVR